MTAPAPILIWFRRDLRLADHGPIADAVASGAPMIPVYIHAPEADGDWAPGAASRWWLHHSLQRLDADLRGRGSRLILRQGPSADTLVELARETGAASVYWHRRVEPAAIQLDAAVTRSLRNAGVDPRSYGGALLQDPALLRNKSGGPYKVFTPFYNHLLTLPPPPAPAPAPARIHSPSRMPPSMKLGNLGLLPTFDWAGGLREAWTPGEAGAHQALQKFLRGPAAQYPTDRDRPDRQGTSALSPHLHFGEISPTTVWHTAHNTSASMPQAATSWLRQLAWREFSSHLLFHFPESASAPLRPQFQSFPWREDPGRLQAWRDGSTGYPIVDAGMRELWVTGWMHNRVRMIAASFLVKDLLVSWLEGARWFWDTLVDADLANNTMGWQWTAGCGADAAPFFRIFNPVSQGRKFDPDGAYVRTWLPALRDVPTPYIHEPWKAPPAALQQAGLQLGNHYPERIVHHHIARMRAMDALHSLRG